MKKKNDERLHEAFKQFGMEEAPADFASRVMHAVHSEALFTRINNKPLVSWWGWSIAGLFLVMMFVFAMFSGNGEPSWLDQYLNIPVNLQFPDFEWTGKINFKMPHLDIPIYPVVGIFLALLLLLIDNRFNFWKMEKSRK